MQIIITLTMQVWKAKLKGKCLRGIEEKARRGGKKNRRSVQKSWSNRVAQGFVTNPITLSNWCYPFFFFKPLSFKNLCFECTYFHSSHLKHFILGDFWVLFQLTWFYIRHLCDKQGNSLVSRQVWSFLIWVMGANGPEQRTNYFRH